MNYGYNHGSQGNLLNASIPRVVSVGNVNLTTHAPDGTGDQLRKLALEGNTNELKALVVKFKNDPIINEGDVIGLTALHTAASHGHVECVKLLLEHGADPHLKNHYGQTALQHATHPEIVEILTKFESNTTPSETAGCMIM